MTGSKHTLALATHYLLVVMFLCVGGSMKRRKWSFPRCTKGAWGLIMLSVAQVMITWQPSSRQLPHKIVHYRKCHSFVKLCGDSWDPPTFANTLANLKEAFEFIEHWTWILFPFVIHAAGGWSMTPGRISVWLWRWFYINIVVIQFKIHVRFSMMQGMYHLDLNEEWKFRVMLEPFPSTVSCCWSSEFPSTLAWSSLSLYHTGMSMHMV